MDAFWDGLTEEQVRAACCSRVWSTVVESFLKGNSGRACKHKLVRKMASAFVEIARDKYGFHAALTALATCAADGHTETHAQLSRAIKQNREYVGRNEWGAKLLKKLAQQRREEDEAEEAAAPLTVESLLAGQKEQKEQSKKSKKKAKKRNKKREREEDEEEAV